MDMSKALEELGQVVTEKMATLQAELAEVKKQGAVDPVLSEKLDKLIEKQIELDEKKAKLEEQEKLDKRVSELEADLELMQKGRAPGGSQMTNEEKQHLDAFAAWVRDPHDGEKKQALKLASKTVATTSNGAGGYAVPEVISRTIYEKLQDISPLRQVVDVTVIPTSDYKEVVDVNGESYEWVGEGDTRNQQTEPQLEQVSPTMGTVNAYYWANEEAVDDMFIQVQGWLVRAAARAFARAEGAAFVSGNGTDKPTGFLNASPVATGDEDSPARTFGTVQYFPTGVAYAADAPFGNIATTSPYFYPDNAFINCMTGLKTGYTGGAQWLMNRTTMGHVMKLRDSEGNPLWQQSMIAGKPNMIFGYPVIEFPDMPDVGTNAHPVAFGNFREGYLFVERHGVRITMDEVTKPGAIKWNIRRRVGGKTRNDDAIKVIKLAAS